MGILVQYYKKNNKRVGVVVAVPPTEKHPYFVVGFSRCNYKKGDVFDKEIGYNIAIGRAKKSQEIFPQTICNNISGLNDKKFIDYLLKFHDRAMKYYGGRIKVPQNIHE